MDQLGLWEEERKRRNPEDIQEALLQPPALPPPLPCTAAEGCPDSARLRGAPSLCLDFDVGQKVTDGCASSRGGGDLASALQPVRPPPSPLHFRATSLQGKEMHPSKLLKSDSFDPNWPRRLDQR